MTKFVTIKEMFFNNIHLYWKISVGITQYKAVFGC